MALVEGVMVLDRLAISVNVFISGWISCVGGGGVTVPIPL